MSTFSQFTNGNRIKSIQRGTISFPNNVSSTTATIASVNPSKTELRMLGVTCNGIAGVCYISLTSGTQITAVRAGTAGGLYTTVSWELTEFF